MMLDKEIPALYAQVDDLAKGAASIEDWCRVETRLRKVMQHANRREMIESLRLLRLCVQSRIYELEASARRR